MPWSAGSPPRFLSFDEAPCEALGVRGVLMCPGDRGIHHPLGIRGGGQRQKGEGGKKGFSILLEDPKVKNGMPSCAGEDL